MARALLIPVFGFILSLVLSTGAFAQENTETDRSATGGRSRRTEPGDFLSCNSLH